MVVAIMIFIQVVLGGITRLTGSGLSIVRWEIVTGVIPPMSDAQWHDALHAYLDTPQGKLNRPDCICDFKTIYLWEWGHRMWGRLIGLALIIPFAVLVIRRKLSGQMLRKTLLAIGLVVAIGVFGWLMVRSGLIARPSVSPYMLALHMGLTMITLSFILWLALSQFSIKTVTPPQPKLRQLAIAVTVVIGVQIVFGALMSGMKGATVATDWPLMNGKIIPPALNVDVRLVHFTHRLLAYTLFVMIIWQAISAVRSSSLARGVKRHLAGGMTFMVILQSVLGILTLDAARTGEIPLDRALTHQALGVLMLLSMMFAIYRLRPIPLTESTIE